MAAEGEPQDFQTPTHQLVEVVSPDAGVVLSSDGCSSNLTRNTRVVSDRVVFVDNIADSVSKEEFVNLIKEYASRGPIVDVRFLQRTKGGSFAFVEFQKEEDGRDAMAALNNRNFPTSDGKVMELRASKAENPTEMVSNKNLYVRGIPTNWTQDDLKDRFRGFGTISHCRTLKRPGSENENTGVGFVHFFHAVDAAKAIEGIDGELVDPEDPNSGALEVKFARAKKPRQRNNNNRRRRRGGRGRHGGDYGGRAVPNWNFGQRRAGMGGRGRNNMRGNRNGNWNMYGPPNEEVWAKMVEIMQKMSFWQQNPYTNTAAANIYGQNYQQYNYNPNVNDSVDRGNSDNTAGNF